MQKPYVPVCKKAGFNPNPVAGNIPLYADSITNPKVIGTKAYDDFWSEQIDRCINGYDTAGMHLSGRYYYFLNFRILRGLKGLQYPFFVDLDKEYWDLIDYVKEKRKPGILTLKARRVGLSELNATLLSHGLRFTEGYRGAVTAGIETYVIGLRNKFEFAQNNVIQDLRLNVIENNDKIYNIGYERKNEIGGFIEEGYGGFISFETMYDDPTKLEGEYFHDVICEESGRYPKLGSVISSIWPALEFGSQMLGTFFIYGTGGNILSSSKDFKEYWDNAETLGFEKFWIPGNRKYYPFYGNPKEDKFIDPDSEKVFDAIPNLRKYRLAERVGMEDIEAAREYILRKRLEYAKLPNKKKLKEHNQAHPLSVEEAWTSGGSNNFNFDKIYERLFEIEGDPNTYQEVILEWVMDNKGMPLPGNEMRVKHRPAKLTDPDWRRHQVNQFPLHEMSDLDVGGIDSYNQDESKTSKSLGSMVVLRQGNKTNMENQGIPRGLYPIHLYYKRPPLKEQFYDECLKVAVWYGLIRNTMCNAEQDFVIDYFNKNGGSRYLSQRPKAFDAPKTKQVHKYGAKMTGYSKELILGVVQTWVENFVNLCNFPLLLRDLLAYDEEFIGTDWDSVDALAYAIMRVEDMRTRPRRNDEDPYTNDEPIWVSDRHGNMVIKNPAPSVVQNEYIEQPEHAGRWTALDYKERKNYD